jgi:hypothetical protein
MMIIFLLRIATPPRSATHITISFIQQQVSKNGNELQQQPAAHQAKMTKFVLLFCCALEC